MKLIHTSDWHLGKNLYGYSLLEDQRLMLEQLVSVIAEERADAVLIAGDIYDRPVPAADAVQLYNDFLTEVVVRMGVPVAAVAGNHDSPGRLEFGSSLYRQSGYHIAGHIRAEIETVTLYDEHGPLHLHLIPYLHPADVRALFGGEPVRTFDDAYRLLLAKNIAKADPVVRNVAVAHGFFAGFGGREAEVVTSDSELNVGGLDMADSACFAAFDYAALGHLHAPQRAGGERIRYSGSPLKYSLSEQGQEKSFTLVELGEKGDVKTTLIPVAPRRDVRTVRGRLDDLLEPSFHQNRSFGDYIFAEILGGRALYPMEKLRALFPNILGLRFLDDQNARMPEISAVKHAEKLTTEEHFSRFFRDVKGYDLPEGHLLLLREVLAALPENGEAEEV